MKSITLCLSTLLLLTTSVFAQATKDNPWARMGEKALLDGDFKLAISHLEKSLPADSNNVQVLIMLGYSYYHTANYSKAINSFSRAVSLKPNEGSPYYYRGKARDILATQLNTTLSFPEREKLLQASIKDFSKAIELDEADTKLYQNRGIAYRDLGILKSQKTTPKFYDKTASAAAYKACMVDLQKVLDTSPNRPDIVEEMKKAKVYLANLDN